MGHGLVKICFHQNDEWIVTIIYESIYIVEQESRFILIYSTWLLVLLVLAVIQRDFLLKNRHKQQATFFG
jgi:hypothetical protein